jgi:hypothetical protein
MIERAQKNNKILINQFCPKWKQILVKTGNTASEADKITNVFSQQTAKLQQSLYRPKSPSNRHSRPHSSKMRQSNQDL